MIKVININSISVMLVILALHGSCSSSNKDKSQGTIEREEKLKTLKSEETALIDSLEKVIDPDLWGEFKESSLKTAKEDPEQAKEFLTSTSNIIMGLYEVKAKHYSGQISRRTYKTLEQMIGEVQQCSFKAKNAEEGIASLEQWEKLLKKILMNNTDYDRH